MSDCTLFDIMTRPFFSALMVNIYNAHLIRGRGRRGGIQFDSTETSMKSNVCVRFGVGPRGSSAAPAD